MTQKSIKKNSIYNVLRTASSILFPLVTFPYISRVLLTDNVGKINFGASIVSYFSLMASLGISTYATRECSGVRDDPEKLSNTASQIWTINLLTTVAAYAALGVTLLLYRPLRGYRTMIVIQSLAILVNTLGADWLNSAMEDFRYITIRTMAVQWISLLLMLLFVHRPEDYMIYVVLTFLSSAGAGFFNIWYRRRYCRLRVIRNLRSGIEWKRHMMPILYLFVMMLAQTIFHSVDSTMLGIIHGNYEVGIYSAAHKITNMINQVIGSMLWVIMPRMSYYFAEERYEELNRLLRKVLGFNLLLGLPCAVGCWVIAEDVIRVAAGDAFIEAAPVLQILMIGFVFSLIGGNFLGNAVLLPSKQEKYYMIVCCVTAVVNVIGNAVFIPLFGARAAAGTTAGCGLLIMLLLLFRVDRRIRIRQIGRLVLPPAVGCAGIVLVCLLLRSIGNLWIRTALSITLGAAVYGAVQVLMKNELTEDVLAAIRRKLGKEKA